MNTASAKNNWHYIVIVVLAVALVGTAVWALNESQKRNNSAVYKNTSQNVHEDTQAHLESHGITPLEPAQASNSQTTADELSYLLEEEKLAYDVYNAMYEKWGVRIFDNIKNSEDMHQSMVLAIMESRNLPDSRTSEAGVFNDQDLQNLYNKLIAQGNQSVTEAYKVGVTIEETDIADLNKTLETLDPKDTDIKALVENLIHSSENHLRAFNRQLNR